MAISFRCPGCKEEFQVDEAYGGRKWRCTNCTTTFVIPTPGPPATPGAPPPNPATRGYRVAPNAAQPPSGTEALTPGWESYGAALRVVNSGVLFALVGFLLYVGMTILLPFYVKDLGPGLNRLMGLTPQLAEILAFIAIVLLFVGVRLSCVVPGKTGAKGWVVLSISLAGLGLATLIGAYISYSLKKELQPPLPNAPGVWKDALLSTGDEFMLTKILTWSGLGLLALSHFCYAVSLKSVASFNRGGGLGAMALLYVVLYLAFIGGTVFLIASWNFLGVLEGGLSALAPDRQSAFLAWTGTAAVLAIWFILLGAVNRGSLPQR